MSPAGGSAATEAIPTVYNCRARKANAARFGDDLRLAEATRDMAVAKAARAIRLAVAAVPPITEAQRIALVALLIQGRVA